MTDELYLKPAERRRVRKPDGALLAAHGEGVPRESFWLRRLVDEDVVETTAGEIAKAAAAAAKAAAPAEEKAK